MSPSLRSAIERWFVRHGVPQLVEGYTAERRMDTRALPLIAVWLVLGTVLFWGTREDWSPALNGLGVVGTLSAVGIGVWLLRKAWGHWVLGREVPATYIFALGPLVAAPSAVVHASWLEGIGSGLNALLGVGIIYVTVGVGLAEIAGWSLRRLHAELVQIVSLLSTTLPVLLILVFFLIFSAEVWETAHLLAPSELLLVLALVGAVAVLLVVSAIRTEMRAIQVADSATLCALAEATPAAAFVTDKQAYSVAPLTALQQFNLHMLAVIAQLIQSLFVATFVTGSLVVFGVISLPVALQERWIGEAATVLLEFELLGEARALSLELLTVTALLGSIVGLYFTGLAVTDSVYRQSHFDRIADELRTLVAAHAVYVTALRESDTKPARANI